MGADFPLTQSHATIFSLKQTLNRGTYKFHLCATPKLPVISTNVHTVRDWSTLNPRYQSGRVVDSLRSYQDRAVLLQSTPKHLLRTNKERVVGIQPTVRSANCCLELSRLGRTTLTCSFRTASPIISATLSSTHSQETT